jgi:hypothetical protein
VIPNLYNVIDQTRKDYPRAWEHCHHPGDPEAHDFIILAARRCHDKDYNFGLNGKRGGDVLSWDALNWRGDSDDPPNVIDVVAGAGGSNPQPSWQVTNTTGKWFDPYRVNTYYNYSGGGEPTTSTTTSELTTDTGEDYLTRDEVQALIDASIAAALANVVKYGERAAFRSDDGNGKLLCAEQGGPEVDGNPFTLTARSSIGPWESWKIERV